MLELEQPSYGRSNSETGYLVHKDNMGWNIISYRLSSSNKEMSAKQCYTFENKTMYKTTSELNFDFCLATP